MDYVLDITSSNGVPFRVVYGFREYLDGSFSSKKVVSFYDRRYQHTKHGQFVSDYNVDTLCDHPQYVGLTLWGTEPSWVVDGNTMELVHSWLMNIPEIGNSE